MTVLDDLEPRTVLGLFETLTTIPRGSTNEKQVSDWIVGYARERGLDATQDEMHNVLVRKPGQHGLEDAPTVILHGHMDMVCEKEEGVSIDFATEGISLLVDGEFITADGTSLGADNGIGVSYILALLGSEDLPHPPLEAVLTAMEEKGKVGAAHFDASQLTGRRMIDFNWITDTEILAGCSGDVTFTVDVPAEWEDVPGTHTESRTLLVRGLVGGHCEFDIHLERANAVQVLTRALSALAAEVDVRLAEPHGGAQNNAIPADAQAVLAIRPEDVATVEKIVQGLQTDVRFEYETSEPRLRIELGDAEAPARVFSVAAAARLARIASLIPHGVLSWNLKVPGVVETSNNLGTVRTTDDGAQLMSTITAAVTSRKHDVADKVRGLCELAGGGVAFELYGLDAPEFPYRPDSPLLKIAQEAYRDVIGGEPDVEVSQCSLELGMFSQRVPGLDTISIGTELHALHSPQEKVRHTSVAKVWPLVQEVMSRLR